MRVRIQMRTITDPEGKLLGAAGGRRELMGKEKERVRSRTRATSLDPLEYYALPSLIFHLRPFTNYTPSWQACVTTSKRAKFSVDLVVIHDEKWQNSGLQNYQENYQYQTFQVQIHSTC